jgi:hypothetical protein
VTAIDFLIIGAQKSGTTSLFEYMRRHPEIYMPPEKEIAFFEVEQAYRRGFDWFEAAVTADAPEGALCGTASVGYMTGTPHRDIPLEEWRPQEEAEIGSIEEMIPLRIREVLPEAKLFCVLRDPVERAFSHFRMAVLEGQESRPFDVAIASLMEPRTMRHARAVATGYNGYIVRGEYARILDGFLRVFPREQLMLTLSDELAQDPAGVLPSIFGFLGVAPDFVPDNLGTRYRAAAVRQRIPGLTPARWQARLARVELAAKLWHRLPTRARRPISRAVAVAGYRADLWNAQRGVDEEPMDPSVRQSLIAHFRPDSERLSAAFGLELPWLKTWG